MVSCQKDADVKNYGHMLCTLCVLACVWCGTVHLCVGCDSRDPAAFWSDSLRVEGDLASACVPARVPLRTPQSLHRVDCQCGCGLNGGDMVRKELGGARGVCVSSVVCSAMAAVHLRLRAAMAAQEDTMGQSRVYRRSNGTIVSASS